MLVTSVVRRVIELVFLEQIFSARRIAFGQYTFVFSQERRTLLRGGEHFVRIPGDRIGSAGDEKQKLLLSRISFQPHVFIFILFYLSIPVNRCLCFLDTKAPPPQAASTCNHIPYSWQTLAISTIGSNAPNTVVPEIFNF